MLSYGEMEVATDFSFCALYKSRVAIKPNPVIQLINAAAENHTCLDLQRAGGPGRNRSSMVPSDE